MGLFDIFNKNKGEENKKPIVPECFGSTSELLDEVMDLVSRYSVDDNLLDTYNKEKLDIEFLNKARAKLEGALVELGKSLGEYYGKEYTTVSTTLVENKTFSYSLDALVELFNNSLDLYLKDETSRDVLNTYYDKCNEALIKVKEILSDDEAIQQFTGLIPVVNDEIEAERAEEVIEAEIDVDEVTVEENENLGVSESISENNDVDGDLIINTEKMKGYFIRRSRNENDEINISLCIENKLDKDIIVKVKDVTVDGTITEPKFECSILSASRVYGEMIFENAIQEMVNLKCSFYIMDANTLEAIEENSITLFKED